MKLYEGIQQRFPELRLARTGCHFFAILKYIELDFDLAWENETQLKEIFFTALDRGYMGTPGKGVTGDITDCNVLDAVGLANMIMPAYNEYKRDLIEQPELLSIERLVRDDGGTHFLCNGWDPMPPDRPAAKTWRHDSWRCFV